MIVIIRRALIGHKQARLIFTTALSVFLFFVSQSSMGQETADDVIRINTNLVQLNIGVIDHQGKPVIDLQRNNFAIYEDGVRQNLNSFESITTPFSLALLLDMSGSTLGFRQNLKFAAWRFIDALAPDDRVAVIGFNQRTELLTNFTIDRAKITWAIERADGHGGTELYSALDYALKHLASEGRRRKAIIVLTDGLDTSMRNLDRATSASAQTDEEAVALIKTEASKSLSAVLDAADRQGVTIYPLVLPSGDLKRLPIVTPQITAIYTAARIRLETLARRTGAQLSDIRQLQDLVKTYASVAADLRTLYTVSYQPSGGQGRDGRWREIRVDIDRPELIARTRPGYYAR